MRTDSELLYLFHFCSVDADEEEMRDFVKEMDVMKNIGYHPNVVRFFGVCTRKL